MQFQAFVQRVQAEGGFAGADEAERAIRATLMVSIAQSRKIDPIAIAFNASACRIILQSAIKQSAMGVA